MNTAVMRLPVSGRFSAPAAPVRSPTSVRVRSACLVLVFALHGLVFWHARAEPDWHPDARLSMPVAVRWVTPAPHPAAATPAAIPTPKPVEPKPEPKPTPKPEPKVAKAKPQPKPKAKPVTAPQEKSMPAAAPSGAASLPAARPVASPTAEPVYRPAQYQAAYLHNPAPTYPPMSRRQQEEGTVMLKVRVSSEGKAKEVQVEQTSGFNRLDMAALRAVTDWQFVPARRGERAEEAWVRVPIHFQLRNS